MLRLEFESLLPEQVGNQLHPMADPQDGMPEAMISFDTGGQQGRIR
jgi:hypothetical protein